ncbi:MAG: hypothetical protein K6C99_09680 [Lachnospiraceae bacterium]|nr:hypothetical protein [Lachnospiraceae bacterium]
MLKQIPPYVKKYLFIIILSLLTEIYILNFRYWCTLSSEKQTIAVSDITTNENIIPEKGKLRILSTDTAVFLFSHSGNLKSLSFTATVSGNSSPYVYYINTVKTASDSSYRIEDNTIKQAVTVYDEGGHELFYKERISSLSEENSMFINLPTGNYYVLTELSYDNSKLSADAFVDSICVNNTIPFDFNPIRFLTITLLLVFITAFAPCSKIWNKPVNTIHVVLLPAVLVFCIFIGIGILNPIWLKETPPVDSYGELTKALARGHFYTDLIPDPNLLQMADPYNYELRESEQVDYLLDYAYYDGKYYVYFGVVPSVIAFLPYYMITGKMLSYSSCFFAVLAFFLSGLALFLSCFIKRYYGNISCGSYISSYILLVLMSSINVLFYAWMNYSIPQFFAITFFVWGAFFYTKAGSQTKHDKLFVAAGSFCFALIAGCRPQLAFCALLAYPLLREKMIKKGTLRYWLAFILPFALVALPLMYYNYARFGSVTDFGVYYNLTVGQIHKQPFSLSGYKSALLFYLFTIPQFNTEFPWINYHIPDLIAENITDNLAGYFIIFPVSLISLLHWPIKAGRDNSRTIFRITLVILSFFMITVAYFYLVIRYLFDFSILLGAESTVMLLDLEAKKKYQMIAHAVMLVSILSGMVYYFLYFSSSYANMLTLNYTNPDCWYEIYKSVCFWK